MTSVQTLDKASGRRKSVVREYAESIIIAVVLALVIRTFIVQAFKIPAGSMEDSLLIGDHILVNKLSYGIQLPILDSKIRDRKSVV
jgi:signal peptidase I